MKKFAVLAILGAAAAGAAAVCAKIIKDRRGYPSPIIRAPST